LGLRESSSMTTLDFYTTTGPFTAPGRHARALESLPRELPGLAAAIPGLLIHQQLTALYGVEHSAERKRESQLRPLEAMLDALLALDGRPLSAAREPQLRLCGVCRHFTLLLTAALKQRGVPARARVGFADYFKPGHFEDHWVCECWNAAQRRPLTGRLDAAASD
ncbi:MAG TPA: transglutaminase domain-containing protein, partial [Polyangiales bacterium]|nr:transglutaminase domain-containing protein [Polyangiales bacterium]